MEFIRRFEEDYKAKPVRLIENYRSTANIIAVANDVIAPAAQRMKAGHDIVVNRARKKDAIGGLLERLDPIGRGRVHVLRGARNELEQAVLAVNELERLSKPVPDWDWAKAAVIAREWRYLQPVRSYCEARGIPVQAANADPPNCWRLRETQKLVSWLRDRESSAVRGSDVGAWIDEQPAGPWWSALREGIEEFSEELGDRETDRKDALEWFAEWSREVRKRQSGLLLLSAHRAKGLEFDDVVVLDGGWDRQSRGEDRDAARRLYYVAMTRARRSLTLLSTTSRHPIIRDLKNANVLSKSTSPDASAVAECRKIYQTLNLSEVDLSFAGRLHDGDRRLIALESLGAGDPIRLKQVGDAWVISDCNDVQIGRLAKKFKPPEGANFVEGSVFAISTRCRSDSAEEYQAQLKRDDWSVVLPELVFEVE